MLGLRVRRCFVQVKVFPLPKANATENRSLEMIPRPKISDLLRTELEDLHAKMLLSINMYVGLRMLMLSYSRKVLVS